MACILNIAHTLHVTADTLTSTTTVTSTDRIIVTAAGMAITVLTATNPAGGFNGFDRSAASSWNKPVQGPIIHIVEGACTMNLSYSNLRTRVLPQIPHVLFPNTYVWFVFLASMDVMLTYCVISYGGVELNVLADAVLKRWNLWGLVTYKFSLVSLVLIICEYVGHRRLDTGRFLARFAVGLTAVPVVLSMAQLLLAASDG